MHCTWQLGSMPALFPAALRFFVFPPALAGFPHVNQGVDQHQLLLPMPPHEVAVAGLIAGDEAPVCLLPCSEATVIVRVTNVVPWNKVAFQYVG